MQSFEGEDDWTMNVNDAMLDDEFSILADHNSVDKQSAGGTPLRL